MSTLSSNNQKLESIESFFTKTLATIVACFLAFTLMDFLRGVPMSQDISAMNALGAFAITLPTWLFVAGKNPGRWSANEYMTLAVLTVLFVGTHSLPVALVLSGILPALTAEELGVSVWAIAKFNGYMMSSALVSLVALIAFVFYGIRARVWDAYKRIHQK
jgi:hypothetical protein